MCSISSFNLGALFKLVVKLKRLCAYCTVIADEPERPWSSRAINSYRPADAFQEITSCGGGLPIKVLPANQEISRTSASALACNGVAPTAAREIFFPSRGATNC